ncbi:MAG: hypothetical protein U1A78_25025 [Polyangia bacterium]
MLYDALNPHQLALRMITNILLAVGAVGLLLAGYLALFRSRRALSGPAPRSLAKLSLVALTVGAALYATTHRITEPRRTPGSVVLDTPAHYRGTSNPAIELRAPAGWTLRRTESPDKQSFQVHAVQQTPPVTLAIETMTIDDFTSADKTLRAVADALSNIGVRVEPDLFDDTLAGKPARGLLAQRADGLRFVTWLVPLSGSTVGQVQCFAPTDSSPRQACLAPIAQLRWTIP